MSDFLCDSKPDKQRHPATTLNYPKLITTSPMTIKRKNNVTSAFRGSQGARYVLSLLLPALCLLCSIPTYASDDDKLLMSITTLTDTLRFTVAADELSGTIKVDYGDGKMKPFEVRQGVKTLIEGITQSAEKERVVKVYGAENLINSFQCTYYGLTALDLSGCPKLTDITCDHNLLTTLDVSKNTELLWLNANDNEIKTVSFPSESKLQTLWLNNSQISSIDLSGMKDLIDLRLLNCGQLRSLNVSSNTKLTRLEVPGAPLYNIDVSHNAELSLLDVSMSNIYSIDVTHNPKLTQLGVGHLPNSSYKLSSIDVSHNPELFYLNASGNRIKEIDLSNNPELQVLNIWENELTSIDLTGNSKMTQLLIRDNYLNYNTLPIDDKLTYYIYNPQKPVKVNPEYAAGGELDLSKEVYNPDYEIGFSLYLTSSDIYQDPGKPLVDGVDYTVDKGVVKFLKSQSDSVYCSVTHEKFPDMELKTTKFLVRNPGDMGKSSLSFMFSPNKELESQLLIRMTAYESDSKVEVDFGDGNLEEFTIGTSSSGYILGNLKGETVKVYTMPGVQIRDLNLSSGSIKWADLSRLHALRTIDLSGNELEKVDFSQNFVVETIKVNKNRLSELELMNNNVLSNLDCSENELSSLRFGGVVRGLTMLNCNSNHLETLDISSLYPLTNLQARNNCLRELSLYNNTELTTLYLDSNELETLDLSANQKLNFLSLTGNCFKFSTLPETTARYYTYNNQKEVAIPIIGHSVDLSSEMMVHDKMSDTDISTVYVWKDSSGKRLYEDEDYTISDGITTFIGPDYENMGKVYCEMTNEAYRDLTLKTTLVQPADLPSTVLAEVDVKSAPGSPVHLNMAAAKPIFLYVDFGDGVMRECALKTTYRIFDATLGDEKKIKVYCYDTDDSPVTVFSLMNLELNSVDVSKLSEVTCLNFSNSGLKTLDISNNLKIEELLMADNRFDKMDLRSHSAIRTLNLRNNRLTEVPAGLGDNLSSMSLDGNNIEKADFTALINLRVLSMTNNKLEMLDLSKNARLEQLDLSDNSLSKVQFPENDVLTVVHLENNKLRFSTMPIFGESVYFCYAPQDNIEISANGNFVDLGSEYDIDGTITEYTWRDAVKELEDGTDYIIENGVTEFLCQPEGDVVCKLTNSRFPNLELNTVPLNVIYSSLGNLGDSIGYGIRVIDATIHIYYETTATTQVYDMTGCLVRNLGEQTGIVEISGLKSGVYIIKHTIDGKSYTDKVIVR